ncbi:adenine deaminase [Filimonas effusa]|uniref:Adenine deaminase n=1 Tax=Filimonas effusa TaxID=2508721 RepID=A0A4Q1D3H9_9BACT|nr:adenine deaminase [Filimonas effusa]RXK81723.1 adenine deaminase [Filimonas effusa]
MANTTNISGQLVDVWQQQIYPATISFENGKISSITRISTEQLQQQYPGAEIPYIMPGFTDSHVHIESSLLVPSEFARLAVVHGTVATVSDPHEIANVCGLPGVHYMIENGKQVPFKFNFGAPSCVPATSFETAGAALNSDDVAALLALNDIRYLSEMMNFPGVLNGDPEVMKKIAAAQAAGKPVDGHAPGLRGEEAAHYIATGISTDHECFTAEEALDKLQHGMMILIREGSAARNFEALIPLLHDYPGDIMFCSDDKHPDSLVAGHINQLCARAVAYDINLFHVLQAACVNPVVHYNLPVGLLREGDPADFILVKDLTHFQVFATYINGLQVSDGPASLIPSLPGLSAINQFHCAPIQPEDLQVSYQQQVTIPVIEALDGQLITNRLELPPLVEHHQIIPNLVNDVLKVVVVNRYHQAPPAIAWIKNFGIQNGAIASSVAHDSHNIIAVGSSDESITEAINLVIAEKGGLSCVIPANDSPTAAGSWQRSVLPLPVAGLMSLNDGYEVAATYTALDRMAKSTGSTLASPFMTLSFMALLVIPHLKLSDKGLFNGNKFQFE